MKLLDTFITTSALYLIAYYGVLFFFAESHKYFTINISVLFRRKVILYDIDYRWM